MKNLIASIESTGLFFRTMSGFTETDRNEATRLDASEVAFVRATYAGCKIKVTELVEIDTTELDVIVRNLSAFKSFAELLNAEGGYFPSIDVSKPEGLALAVAYDGAQIARGDARRAYRRTRR